MPTLELSQSMSDHVYQSGKKADTDIVTHTANIRRTFTLMGKNE